MRQGIVGCIEVVVGGGRKDQNNFVGTLDMQRVAILSADASGGTCLEDAGKLDLAEAARIERRRGRLISIRIGPVEHFEGWARGIRDDQGPIAFS